MPSQGDVLPGTKVNHTDNRLQLLAILAGQLLVVGHHLLLNRGLLLSHAGVKGRHFDHRFYVCLGTVVLTQVKCGTSEIHHGRRG